MTLTQCCLQVFVCLMLFSVRRRPFYTVGHCVMHTTLAMTSIPQFADSRKFDFLARRSVLSEILFGGVRLLHGRSLQPPVLPERRSFPDSIINTLFNIRCCSNHCQDIHRLSTTSSCVAYFQQLKTAKWSLWHAAIPDNYRLRIITKRKHFSRWNVFSDMCTLRRWSVWSSFDANRSTSDEDMREKLCLHFRSPWP